MKLDSFLPKTLKSRVTLFTLLIVVAGFWSLAFYTNRMLLRDEIQALTGEQQRSALSLLVSQVNLGLEDRLAALQSESARVTPAMLADAEALRGFLADRSFTANLFNAGMMAWDSQGVLVAAQHRLDAQALPDALDRQDLSTVLKTGQAVIGGVRRHGRLGMGVFAMAVPIRDTQGAVIGAMSGAMRLDQTNFLSRLTTHPYGRGGNFFLIEPRQRLIFATSDPSRLMEVLPAPGVSPWIDRFMQGFEGTARVVNPHGVEVLVSIQQIPKAHWYASVTLPSEEAFSLIHRLRLRVAPVALALTLFCGMLIWLMLRHQLAPMRAAVDTLDSFVSRNQAPQALRVYRNDEIGFLVSGFNRLLDTLAQQQKLLQGSELFKQAVLDSVASEIAVLDHEGVIVAVNDAWRRWLREQAAESGQGSLGADVGANYLAYCQSAPEAAVTPQLQSAQDGIRGVLAGRLPRFQLQFARHSARQARWLNMSVTPLEMAPPRGAVLSLEDITERIEMENQVRELAFYDPLTQLPNRRLVLDRLTQQMVRARRTQTRLALLFIDLDKFKPINDELGHEAGDWLLQTVAQRILGCLRESDTAGRFGGDEFVVLLPDLHSSDLARVVAEKIRLALAQDYVAPQGKALHISASIGVAIYPDHAGTEQALLRLGDEAMYHAKKGGRDAVHLCAPIAPAEGPRAGDVARQPFVYLRWKAAFASGHPEIDQEHEAMFGLTNALLDKATWRREQPREFDLAFEALLAHVEAHFAHEEAMLSALGSAHLADHARQHQALVAQARALHHAFQQGDAAGATEERLIEFLVSDLVAGHMLRSDRALWESER